jgi:hypothetical protein
MRWAVVLSKPASAKSIRWSIAREHPGQRGWPSCGEWAQKSALSEFESAGFWSRVDEQQGKLFVGACLNVHRGVLDHASPAHIDGKILEKLAGATRLELATSCVTGRRSNQLNYAPASYDRLIPSGSIRYPIVPCRTLWPCRDSTAF